MLGYACVNESLKPKRFRTCRLKSVQSKGISYMRDLALDNVKLLKEILLWNIDHDIFMFRVISDLIPLATHPDILEQSDWRWYEDKEILDVFSQVKDISDTYNMRLSMHPDQFTVINSNNPKTVQNSIIYLDYHAKILAAIGGQDMILHVGGVYNNKELAMERFITVYKELDDNIKRYLRLENDDRSYSISDVLIISEATGIPICFDYHHNRCLSKEAIDDQIIEAIIGSWGKLRPKMHMSSGNTNPRDRKHHDYISEEDGELLYAFLEGKDIDVMVEAKKKEKATLRLMKQFRKVLS